MPVDWALVTPLLARTYCCKAVAAAAPLSVSGQNLYWLCQSIWFLLLLWFLLSWVFSFSSSASGFSLPCIPECWCLSVQAAVLSAVHVWRLWYGHIGVGRISLLCLGGLWGLSVCWGAPWPEEFLRAAILGSSGSKDRPYSGNTMLCPWDSGPEMKWFFAAVIGPRQHYYWQNDVVQPSLPPHSTVIQITVLVKQMAKLQKRAWGDIMTDCC